MNDKRSPNERMTENKKPFLYEKSKNSSNGKMMEAKVIGLRPKQLVMNVESPFQPYMTDRKKVDGRFGFNPARFKIGGRYTEHRSPEYFGLVSDR